MGNDPTMVNHDPRAALLQHNSGRWQGCFIRLRADGSENDRFNTTLSVEDVDGVIQTKLTYLNSGQQRSMNFLELPYTMQVSPAGGWTLGPSSITPFNWVGEMCVVRGEERRRIVVRHGASGLDQVVYVIEAKGSTPPEPPRIPVQCQMEKQGDWSVWRPEPDVELLLDTRQRSTGDTTVCGLRWISIEGDRRQIVRRYDANGMLQPLSESWL